MKTRIATVVALLAGMLLTACGEDGPEPWSEAEYLDYVRSRMGEVQSFSIDDSELVRAGKGLCETEFEEYGGPQGWYDHVYRIKDEMFSNMASGQEGRDELIETARAYTYAAAHTYCTEYAEEAESL